jgi:protoheme IX farnesyltransferase
MRSEILKSYYAALKPERTYANVMTTLAGFLFACRLHIDWMLLIYTLLGTTCIVMSACAVNNVTDRGLDTRMPRTKRRATATGTVSASKLTYVAIVLGLVGFAILAVHVNWLTTLLGVIGYVDYTVLYAWTKRTTPWSTLVGTISGSVPLMAGYTAVTNSFDGIALLLGLVMLAWQMVHFYAIAIFRRDDYAAGDLPVWSVRYGVRSTQYWLVAFTVLYLVFIDWLDARGDMGATFLWVMGLLGVYWLYRGITGLRVVKPDKWAKGMFGFSLITLLVLSAMVALSPLLP